MCAMRQWSALMRVPVCVLQALSDLRKKQAVMTEMQEVRALL